MKLKILLSILLIVAAIPCTGQAGSDFTKKSIQNAVPDKPDVPKKQEVKDSLSQHLSFFTKFKKDTTSHWEIALENTYVQDPDSSYFGEGLFSDYSLRRNMQVKGLPLNLEGHLVYQNSTLNKRFSGVKLGFDTKQFVESYQEKLVRKDVKEKLSEGLNDKKPDLLDDMTEKTGKALLKNQLEKKGDEAVQKLTGQSIQNKNLIGQLETRRDQLIDSLRQTKKILADTVLQYADKQADTLCLRERADSLKSAVTRLNSRKDTLQKQIILWEKQAVEIKTWVTKEQKNISTLKSRPEVLAYTEQLPRSIKSAPAGIDTIIQKYITGDTAFLKKIERIRQYGDYQKNILVNQQQKVKELRDWEAKKREEWETLDDPDELKKYAETHSMHISPLHKILLGLKKLELGSVQLHDSPLIIGSMPANGFSGEWQSGKYNLSAAIGKEGETNSNQLTDFFRNTNRFGLNRKVQQVKVGLGDTERTFYGVSFTRFSSNVPLTFEENPIPQQTKNVLLGLHGRQYLSKSLFFSANTVISNTDVTGAITTPALLNPAENSPLGRSALEAALGYDVTAWESTLEAGYSHIGGGYQTLGNPFLITNRNDIKVKIKQKMLKKRLVFTGEARISTNLKNNITPQANQNLYSADMSWRINKKGSRVWVKYQPMTFAQKVGDINNAVQINTAILGYQTNGKIGKSLQWNAVFQGMNFRQESNAADTAFTTGRLYCTAQQSLLSGPWMISFTSYGGFEGLSVKEGQLALTNTWMTKKFQVNGGLQVIRRPFDLELRKGFTAGFSIKLKKRGELGANALWLKQIEDDSRNGFYGTSFLRIII